MTRPTVSVIIVSYCTRDLTLDALWSVRERGHEVPLEVVVVDNASQDDSADAIARDHPWAGLIRSPVNGGFGAGANLGARAASGEWLLFLNSDARLTDGALPRLLAATRSLERPGALGPRLEGPHGIQRSVGRFFGPWRDFVRAFHLYRLFPRWRLFDEIHLRHLPRESTPVDWVSGACMLVRQDVFEAVGGFDEAYFMYVEDMDLCYRLVRAGCTNLYVPDALVHHEGGKSPRDDSKVLVEGGRAAEYFVRKSGMRYPLGLQRCLRAINLFGWSVSLSMHILLERVRGENPDATQATLRSCRRSLAAVFRPRA